jgi:hypothetical protein
MIQYNQNKRNNDTKLKEVGMADQPDDDQNQAISDDQELAKVLAGVNQQAEEAANMGGEAGPGPMPQPTKPDSQDQNKPADEAEAPAQDNPAAPAPAEPMPTPTTSAPESSAPASDPTTALGGDPALDNIKQQALGELRPLVDKLNVDPEEKFDTYLLLLRSTDDKDLIAPAYQAAQGITDEARRAQALLDVIKEIDFLNQK